MSNAYEPEAMRQRFWELTEQKEALNRELEPHRKKYNDLRDKLRVPIAELRAAGRAVVAIERPRMAEIDMEMARLARALGNKVGPRPES
jgi:predicted  nucleic acid-binding Zn-ribbon protein